MLVVVTVLMRVIDLVLCTTFVVERSSVALSGVIATSVTLASCDCSVDVEESSGELCAGGVEAGSSWSSDSVAVDSLVGPLFSSLSVLAAVFVLTGTDMLLGAPLAIDLQKSVALFFRIGTVTSYPLIQRVIV